MSRLCLGTSSDVELLALAANPERTCTAPAPEDVAAAARKAGGADDGSDLRDWYAPAVAALPLHLARIVCQRQNCWWDAQLRRRYAGLLFVAMLALPVVGIAFAALANWSVRELLLRLVVPLLPLPERLWSEQDGQRAAAERIDSLREKAVSLWQDALDGLDASACAERSRALQDAIYLHRSDTQPVPDRLDHWLRNDMNDAMNQGAEQMVEEAQQRLAGAAPGKSS